MTRCFSAEWFSVCGSLLCFMPHYCDIIIFGFRIACCTLLACMLLPALLPLLEWNPKVRTTGEFGIFNFKERIIAWLGRFYPISVGPFHRNPQMSAPWFSKRKGQEFSKPNGSPGSVHVCAKHCGNPSNTCWDIWVHRGPTRELASRLSLASTSPSASVTSCVFAKSLVSHFHREKNPDNLCKWRLPYPCQEQKKWLITQSLYLRFYEQVCLQFNFVKKMSRLVGSCFVTSTITMRLETSVS